MAGSARKLRRVGRYLLADVIASGGMAQVHFGRLMGPGGFSRTCAIKRLHAMLAQDPTFVSTLLDEARLMSRINDAHVVPILDVVNESDEVLIVMEYVAGDSLAGLLKSLAKSSTLVPPSIAAAIVADALHGLHAAHEATNEEGEPLALVHRDVSPHNILVGEDGVARVLDFGIAKARGRLANTAEGQVKGKLAYMAPEQLMSEEVSRRADVYAAGAVLWELLTGKRLFRSESEGALVGQVLRGTSERPSEHVSVSAELDDIVMRALTVDPNARIATAREMAILLEEKAGVASHRKVGEWLREVAGDTLQKRSAVVRQLEKLTEADLEAAGVEDLPPFRLDRSHPLRVSSSSSGSGPVPSTPTADGTSLTLSDVNARRTELSGGATFNLQRRSRGRLLAIAAGGLLLVGLGAFLFSRGLPRGSAPQHAGLEPSAPSSALQADSDFPVASAATTVVVSLAPSSPSASLPSASGEASSSPVANLRRPLVRTRPQPAATEKPTAVPEKPAGGCDPPFTIDARGIRRLKPNCN